MIRKRLEFDNGRFLATARVALFLFPFFNFFSCKTAVLGIQTDLLSPGLSSVFPFLPKSVKFSKNKIRPSLLAKENGRSGRKTVYGKGTRQCSTGPGTDNQWQRRPNDRFKEEEQMAMTITPANDFPSNQHKQVKTGLSPENPAVRAKTEDNGTAQAGGKKAVDSVELSSAAENIAATHSRLADFDQAQETMAALKSKIHQQAGPALQSQANISSATALSLLEE